MRSVYVRQTGKGNLRVDARRLAQDVGVTTSVIYKWLHGRVFPGKHLAQLAQLLGVSREDLITQEIATRTLIPIPRLSTGFPEVDVIVTYLRSELATIWEQAGERITEVQRRRIMNHFQNQVALIREILELVPPQADGL